MSSTLLRPPARETDDAATIEAASRREFLAALAAAGLLAGCATDTADTPAPAAMRQITDSTGRVVDVPLAPQRAVILGEFVAAPVITLGYVPYAVSSDTAEGSLLPRLRSFGGTQGDLSTVRVPFSSAELDIEAVAAQQPDLIIGQPFREDALPFLEALAPTVLVDIGGLEDPVGAQRLLVGLFGLSDAFEERLAEYAARVEAVRARFPGLFDGLEYTFIDQQGPDANYAYDYASYAGEIALRDLGARPGRAAVETAAGPSGGAVSLELLPGLASDVVFLARLDGLPADPTVLQVLAQTAAGRNDQVFVVDQNRWSTSFVQAQIQVLDDIERLFTGREIDTSGDYS